MRRLKLTTLAFSLLLQIDGFAIAQNIRQISKTVIDFGPAIQNGPAGTFSNYWISGRIISLDGSNIIIERDLGYKTEWFLKDGVLDTASPGDMLSIVAVQKMIDANGGMTPGQWLTLAPEVRMMWGSRQVRNYEQLVILHFNGKAVPGDTISTTGVRIGRVHLAGSPETGLINAFDCGVKFDGDISTNKVYYYAAPEGLKAVWRKSAETNSASTNTFIGSE